MVTFPAARHHHLLASTNYTAWWQRNVCWLHRVALDSGAAGIQTRDLLIPSPAAYRYATLVKNVSGNYCMPAVMFNWLISILLCVCVCVIQATQHVCCTWLCLQMAAPWFQQLPTKHCVCGNVLLLIHTRKLNSLHLRKTLTAAWSLMLCDDVAWLLTLLPLSDCWLSFGFLAQTL